MACYSTLGTSKYQIVSVLGFEVVYGFCYIFVFVFVVICLWPVKMFSLWTV